MSFTIFPVLYRDADNYKAGRDFAFQGAITSVQKDALRSALSDEAYFVPTQVGLEHLGADLASFPGNADHGFHELDVDAITVVESITEYAQMQEEPLEDFLARFNTIGTNGWNPTVACDALGIPQEIY